MSKTTSMVLGEYFTAFVEAQVSRGNYGSSADVVRAGLALLEAHEARVQALEDARVTDDAAGETRPAKTEALQAPLRQKTSS